MLTTLKKLLSPRRDAATLTESMLADRGLTRRQLQLLRNLTQLEEWDALLALLDKRISLVAEGLLSPAATSDDLHYQRGRATGLRELPVLVVETLQRADELQDADARRERSAEFANDHRTVATFSTPYHGT